MMRNETVVLGLGNVLMSDEGIGVRIIERLSAESEKFPFVDFIDGGTGGVSVLHHIEGRRKAVIIDCALMGASAGAIKRFLPSEVESVKKLSHQSLHEADILRIIRMAEELNQCPEEVIFFGVEPEHVRAGEELSATLACKMDDYVAVISREISL